MIQLELAAMDKKQFEQRSGFVDAEAFVSSWMWHFGDSLITAVCSRPAISVQASAGQQLLASAQRELTAKAAAASESQHVALYTPLHYVPVPPCLSPCASLSITLLFPFSHPPTPPPPLWRSVFSGCSKLEGGPGFSALSESSVSDDTASSCTGLREEGMGWWWWG